MKRLPERRNHKPGTTLIELLFAVSMVVLLSGTLFQILSCCHFHLHQLGRTGGQHHGNQDHHVGIRNELRNAIAKPEAERDDKGNTLKIPLGPARTIVYRFEKTERRLYRKDSPVGMNAALPDISEMHPFQFDDGQILNMDFDSSYRDGNTFAESELTLDSKAWFKVSMDVLFSDRFNSLKAEEQKRILSDTNDPRRREFCMTITPREVNWLLQASQ